MIDMHWTHDNMHTNRTINALICINNHVNSFINCMLWGGYNAFSFLHSLIPRLSWSQLQ